VPFDVPKVVSRSAAKQAEQHDREAAARAVKARRDAEALEYAKRRAATAAAERKRQAAAAKQAEAEMRRRREVRAREKAALLERQALEEAKRRERVERARVLRDRERDRAAVRERQAREAAAARVKAAKQRAAAAAAAARPSPESYRAEKPSAARHRIPAPKAAAAPYPSIGAVHGHPEHEPSPHHIANDSWFGDVVAQMGAIQNQVEVIQRDKGLSPVPDDGGADMPPPPPPYERVSKLGVGNAPTKIPLARRQAPAIRIKPKAKPSPKAVPRSKAAAASKSQAEALAERRQAREAARGDLKSFLHQRRLAPNTPAVHVYAPGAQSESVPLPPTPPGMRKKAGVGPKQPSRGAPNKAKASRPAAVPLNRRPPFSAGSPTPKGLSEKKSDDSSASGRVVRSAESVRVKRAQEREALRLMIAQQREAVLNAPAVGTVAGTNNGTADVPVSVFMPSMPPPPNVQRRQDELWCVPPMPPPLPCEEKQPPSRERAALRGKKPAPLSFFVPADGAVETMSADVQKAAALTSTGADTEPDPLSPRTLSDDSVNHGDDDGDHDVDNGGGGEDKGVNRHGSESLFSGTSSTVPSWAGDAGRSAPPSPLKEALGATEEAMGVLKEFLGPSVTSPGPTSAAVPARTPTSSSISDVSPVELEAPELDGENFDSFVRATVTVNADLQAQMREILALPAVPTPPGPHGDEVDGSDTFDMSMMDDSLLTNAPVVERGDAMCASPDAGGSIMVGDETMGMGDTTAQALAVEMAALGVVGGRLDEADDDFFEEESLYSADALSDSDDDEDEDEDEDEEKEEEEGSGDADGADGYNSSELRVSLPPSPPAQLPSVLEAIIDDDIALASVMGKGGMTAPRTDPSPRAGGGPDGLFGVDTMAWIDGSNPKGALQMNNGSVGVNVAAAADAVTPAVAVREADTELDVKNALALRQQLMGSLGVENFVAAYGCVRSMSLSETRRQSAGVYAENSDTSAEEALLEQFATIVGPDGMQFLGPFFELVTEEERLAAPIAVIE